MIACPKTIVPGWGHEIRKWTTEKPISLFSFGDKDSLDTKYEKLRCWQKSTGTAAFVISYHTLRSLIEARKVIVGKVQKLLAPEEIARRMALKQTISSILCQAPQMLICDEGHILRTEEIGVTKALSRIQTSRRIVLTGSPLQNRLEEIFHLSEFVRKGKLGSAKDFEATYIIPSM